MNIWQNIVDFFVINGWRIIAMFSVIIFGIIAIKVICRLMKKVFTRRKVDSIVSYFICSVINAILIIILIVAIFDIIGISTAPFVAVLGTIGLALALSMQNSLSNLTSGIIIIITKPFKKGDYVEVSGVEGSIEKITMLTTELITFDNKDIILPNNKVFDSGIINYSREPLRRIDMKFNVAYGTDIDKVKEVITDTVNIYPRILKEPLPIIRLIEQASNSLVFIAKLWVKTPDYWDVYFDIQELMYKAFVTHKIEIPYNKLDVNILDRKEK